MWLSLFDLNLYVSRVYKAWFHSLTYFHLLLSLFNINDADEIHENLKLWFAQAETQILK